MAGEFWLTDRQWASIAPLLPTNQPGAHHVDGRRVISGIVSDAGSVRHCTRDTSDGSIFPPT